MPVTFDLELCDGCGMCDAVCPGDVIHLHLAKSKSEIDVPYLKYPDECWHCGSCRQVCEVDAITIVFPPEMLVI